MKILTRSLYLLILLASLGLTACDNDGPLEEAGENADEAIEEVEDEIDDATDDN